MPYGFNNDKSKHDIETPLPIADGGTGATTAEAARDLLGVSYANATILFDNNNNTAQTLTLPQSVANFDKLVICFRTNVDQYNSVEVWHPNNKYIALGAVANWASDNNIWFKQQVVYLNGNKITPSGNGHQANISASGTYMNPETEIIYITQVIGYKA